MHAMRPNKKLTYTDSFLAVIARYFSYFDQKKKRTKLHL